jgi:hypothetical protein
MKFLVYVLFAVISSSTPVSAAVEQCRFIQAKADREACYDRQDRALAAKRASHATGDARTIDPVEDPVEPMTPEDAALKQSLRSICRGC